MKPPRSKLRRIFYSEEPRLRRVIFGSPLANPAASYGECASLSVQQFTRGLSEIAYGSDPLVQAGVERHFEIIGEALTRLKRLRPEWWTVITDADRIIGFRNVLAHGYDLVSNQVVWQIIQDKLPVLLTEVQGLLETPASRPPSDQTTSAGTESSEV